MSERREKIERLFNLAADAPAGDRARVLAEACQGDEKLLAEVQALLGEHDDHSDHLLDHPLQVFADLDQAAAEPLPEHIGPFRTLGLLGEGGMGRVYRAEQSEPARTVAVKVIRPGLMSAAALRRFAREARVLASLKHPGIAQVYQTGVATMPGGQSAPYLAMELVVGPTLTTYAAERGLTIAQRLALLAKVCDAVQHAHQRGVIHRDLKPGNLLVEHLPDAPADETRSHSGLAAQPKVLDFGVSRLTESEDQTTLLRSEAGQIVGTLAYMSPEQVRADAAAVDTRSDVYALGVIAYELFSGHLPLDMRNVPVPEAARRICEERPRSLGSFHPELRGDIDTIVAKAMDKDRERRYGSAGELAADLRRCLRHEPVTARPASAVYQLTRFAQRNRGLVIAGVAAVLALVAGLVASTVMYVRADRANSRLQREVELNTAVKEYLIRDILQSANPGSVGKDVRVADVLERAAGTIGERFGARPEVEGELRLILANCLVGLDRTDIALEQARLSREAFERAYGVDHQESLRALAYELLFLAATGHDDESIERGRAALARAERLLGSDNEVTLMLAGDLCNTMDEVGRSQEVIGIASRYLPIAQRVLPETSDVVPALQSALANALSAQGENAKALPQFRAIVQRVTKAYGIENPLTLAATNNLCQCLLKANDPAATAEAVRLMVGLPELAEQRLVEGDPAIGYLNLTAASVLIAADRYADAEKYAMKAYTALSHTSGPPHHDAERAARLLRTIYVRLGRPEDLARWDIEWARIRLMTAGEKDADDLASSFRHIAAEPPDAASDVGAFVRMLGSKLDELAPTGDASRARFCANLARVAARIGAADLASSLIDRAEASMPASSTREVDSAILSNARAEAASKR